MPDELAKMVVVLNHDDANSVLASLVMAASIAASGDQVLFFVQPGGAKSLVKGGLEKYQGMKGLPDPVDLYDSIRMLDGSFFMCELGLAAQDIQESDLREGVEVTGASSFLFKSEGAKLSFSY